MDRVGIEPTASRLVSEVTLSFTTSNFVAFSANSRREENRVEQRGNRPASFYRRSNSSPRHPG